MDNVHPYLPVKPYFKEGKYRNIFRSYGSVIGADMVSVGKGKTETCTGRTCRYDKEKYLCADQPSVPLFSSPNLVSGDLFEQEPCMSHILKHNQQIKHKYLSVKSLLLAMRERKDDWGKQLKKDVKTVERRRKQLLKTLDEKDLSDTEMEDEIEDLFFDLGKSMEKYRQYTKELMKEDLNCKKVNEVYSGGSIQFQPWSQTDGGLLMFTTGLDLKTICVQEVKQNHQNSLVKCEKADITFEDTPYELQCARFSEKMLCLSRHTNCTKLLKITKNSEQENPLTINVVGNHESEKQLSSIALNPYLEGEFITSTNTGEIALYKPGADQPVKLVECEHRFSSLDQYWGCHWGMHPREITITDRTGIAVYDIRTSSPKEMDLFALPHAIFDIKERVYISKPHPVKSYYHMLATDHSIVLADQRFPKHPVLHWNHLMLSPPVYMDICCDVVSDAYNQFDDVMLLGSQRSCECHCFQFTTVNHPSSSPAFVSVPWRVSPLDDMYSFVGCEGVVCDPLVVDRRLRAPLTGVAAVPGTQGFTAIQLTSLGDVFFQTYHADSYLKDKTSSYGPGSVGIKMSAESNKVCSDWLRKAEELYISTRGEGQSHQLKMHDLGDIVKDLVLSDDLSHIQCSFCRTCDDLPEYNFTCVVCHTDIRTSKTLIDRIEQNIPIYDSSQDTTDDINAIEELDECLKTVPLEGHTDAFSDILLRLWHDKPVDIDILKQREEEWIKKFKPKLVKVETSTESEDSDEELDSDVDEVDEAYTKDSLFGLMGISMSMYDTTLNQSTGTKSKLSRSKSLDTVTETVARSKRGIKSTDGLECLTDSVKSELESSTSDSESIHSKLSFLSQSSSSKRQKSSEFVLPLMPLSEKTRSIRSDASSKTSVRSYTSSVHGFGATPRTLLKKSLSQTKARASPRMTSEELGIYVGDKSPEENEQEMSMFSMDRTSSLTSSLFSHASPRVLQKLKPAKKKRKSVMGF